MSDAKRDSGWRRDPIPAERQRVFVYGTLMPGRRNAEVAERAGLVAAAPATAHGFRLYHLEPEGYPAVVPGPGVVHGSVLTLAGSLEEMDALEGVDLKPPLYRRRRCVTGDGEQVWIYCFARLDRLAGPGVAWIPEGRWAPSNDFES